jgi:hypothetical protein
LEPWIPPVRHAEKRPNSDDLIGFIKKQSCAARVGLALDIFAKIGSLRAFLQENAQDWGERGVSDGWFHPLFWTKARDEARFLENKMEKVCRFWAEISTPR